MKHALDRHAPWALAAVSVLYLASAVLIASRRLLWNDELYTYYVATLPSVTDIWPALMTGAEQIPPLFHLLMRAVLRLFGTGHVTTRLPETLGVLVMMLSLFRFVAKRTSPFYGLIAMVFPLVTRAYRYAYEARPYGLVMGFSGLALIAWQAAASDDRRRPALVVLTLSLAAALACHYYAILVFVALGIGEIVRSFSRRRLDVAVWATLGVAAIVPLLVFTPLILGSLQYAGTFWKPTVRLRDLTFAYGDLLGSGTTLALAAIVAAVYAMFRHPPTQEPPRRLPPVHEIAAAIGFAAIPLIAFVMAKLVTNAFLSRYVMPGVIGFSILIAFGLYILPRGRALIGTVFIVLLGFSFITGYREALQLAVATSRGTFDAIQVLQRQTDVDLPIVTSEPHVFMDLSFYAPPAIRVRLVYLTDPEASLRRLGHNSVELGMRDLIGPWFKLRVEGYRAYLASTPRFLLYGNLGFLNWITDELRADGHRLELKDRQGDEYLFLVTRREPDG